MNIYLAGPMRNIPDGNAPAFHAAAAKLRAEGHFVFSPAENNLGDAPDIRACLAVDLNWICLVAEAVALLPGWENSTGARAEKATADALGLKVIYLS